MSQHYLKIQVSQIFSLNLAQKCHFTASAETDNVNVNTLCRMARVLLLHPAKVAQVKPRSFLLAMCRITGTPGLESQRDSATKPRVARNELPWVQSFNDFQPQR